jgi:hypothetical protein
VHKRWSRASNRLGDSAKWMAAVLGAALATVVGTSPLALIRQHHPPGIALILALAGLVFLGITLFLVLQVMRPSRCLQRYPECTQPPGFAAATLEQVAGKPWNATKTFTCPAG